MLPDNITTIYIAGIENIQLNKSTSRPYEVMEYVKSTYWLLRMLQFLNVDKTSDNIVNRVHNKSLPAAFLFVVPPLNLLIILDSNLS